MCLNFFHEEELFSDTKELGIVVGGSDYSSLEWKMIKI